MLPSMKHGTNNIIVSAEAFNKSTSNEKKIAKRAERADARKSTNGIKYAKKKIVRPYSVL